jgi:hypothetical protein
MKKIIFAITIGLFCFSTQAQTYEEGDNLLNVGFGLGATFGTGKTSIPPVSASFEHGFTDKISAGALVGFAGSKEVVGAYTFKYSYIIIGARGSYHFYNTDKIDAYGGALLGYNIGNSKVEGPAGGLISPSKVGGVVFGAHVGARYYFNDQIGAFAEVGYGVALLNLGLAVKF